MPTESPAIMLAAGEASGDVHGAALCQALRQMAPQVRLFGMGGPRMAATGMELLADVTGAASIGSNEVLGRLPEIWRAYQRVRLAVAANRPAVLVLIDFPEFNLRLATVARRAGVPVVYYIPPQIWAWRAGRIRTIRKRVSLVLAVFPFEPAIYRGAGVPVEFVGHPVLDAITGAPTRSVARRQLGVPDDVLLIGLLPGSRGHEVQRMTPLLREAASHVASARRQARFVLALAATVDASVVGPHMTGEPNITVVRGQTHTVMRAADLLLVTSGTATLEAALLGAPMVVCYQASRLTVTMGRLLARVPWISLANITLGRGVIPELWRDVTAEGVARAALQLLDTPGALEAQRDAFGDLATALGKPGVSPRAARLVLAAAGLAA